MLLQSGKNSLTHWKLLASFSESMVNSFVCSHDIGENFDTVFVTPLFISSKNVRKATCSCAYDRIRNMSFFGKF